MTVIVQGEGLTGAEVVAVARDSAPVSLGAEARAAIERSHDVIVDLAQSGQPVYGVSTGFGSLADVYIDPDRRTQLQRSLIRSHAAGMGPPVEVEVVRAMVLLRARTLSMGWSGVRLEVVERMLDLLNHDITPVAVSYTHLTLPTKRIV